MSGLAVLLVATPIFGFSLQPPMMAPSLDLSAKAAAELNDEDSASESSESPSEQDSYVLDLRRRNELSAIHRTFGIATWVAMTATVVAGSINYYNRYGLFAGQGDNPCVTGADLGCGTMRVAHAVSAGVTSVLYATTFTLALMMPDPDDLASGRGEFASRLRLHKTLRWVHFGGMLAQVALGVALANNWFGWDRANDYGKLQALATVHMATGFVTWGALSWAAALMVF